MGSSRRGDRVAYREMGVRYDERTGRFYLPPHLAVWFEAAVPADVPVPRIHETHFARLARTLRESGAPATVVAAKLQQLLNAEADAAPRGIAVEELL
ncbi:hypothetical protein L2U69_09965 [Zavarzinia compransoris]|uniref:hypothetical protein n=1 Tax=Zavarzinia marina TaxID=2911065 RepID=UPI001F188CE3|nr:hypothetical protein [Zavarzinia marina]MCF4165968.1 hypothetical protein [Zavarzinia marina]